jgi:hypothetical protein
MRLTHQEVEAALQQAEALQYELEVAFDPAIRAMSAGAIKGPYGDRLGQELTGRRQALRRALASAIDDLRRLRASIPMEGRHSSSSDR